MNNLLQKFEKLKENIIRDIYNAVKANGGKISINKPADLRFYTENFDSDVFGQVTIVDLVINDDSVVVEYEFPGLDESNRYYVDEETSGSLFYSPLYLCSADEIYNILKIMNWRL